ncbi:MAG: ImmA/IrrE family metallo-endopeptidase [Spirochaetia bacterium]|jgi:Zn-dependent peptidase ImmA (M78 family)/lambda repressor-like predicted transcriptional regulator|nr:ImmA/IrrE family metallo-endopeptidase [Spirochaetia bacterium]
MGIENIGDNIRRRMKMDGLTIAKLSAQMGIGTATLSNILNGKSEPKSSTLIKFAEAFNININALLEDSPQLNTLRFRTAKSLSGREKAEREQIRFDTAIWLKNYRYLEDSLDIVTKNKLESILEKDPNNAAKIARKNLFNLKDEKQPVYDIANLIEDAGIKLKIHNFGFKRTNGLSVGSQDEGPAIVVNSESKIPIERQIFTIAHELGHLILHSDSYKDPKEIEDENEENEANQFAGSFLLPEEGLKEEWEESKGLHWVDAVLRIKKIYKVSYQTVLKRLCQINERNKDSVYRNFAIAYKILYNHDLKNFYEPDALAKSDLMEDRFACLVKKAYEQEFISLSRAGEMLDLSLLDMRDRAKAWQENPIDA